MKSAERRKLQKRRKYVEKMKNDVSFSQCIICNIFVKKVRLCKHYEKIHNMSENEIKIKASIQREGFNAGAKVPGSNIRKVTK